MNIEPLFPRLTRRSLSRYSWSTYPFPSLVLVRMRSTLTSKSRPRKRTLTESMATPTRASPSPLHAAPASSLNTPVSTTLVSRPPFSMIWKFFAWPESALCSQLAPSAWDDHTCRHVPARSGERAGRGSGRRVWSARRSSRASSTPFPTLMAAISWSLGLGSLASTNIVPLLPREMRSRPSLDMYVVSIQPLTSSSSSAKGTGYGMVKGRALKLKAASVNWKSTRTPGDTGG
mmetsp:Transcript_6973/g.24253  ORF Transcript_6973/g.24253 Transcript_6973/m.24253 type:complete len:232 (-) Transcript_6973:466-1161(-)